MAAGRVAAAVGAGLVWARVPRQLALQELAPPVGTGGATGAGAGRRCRNGFGQRFGLWLGAGEAVPGQGD